MNSLATCKQMLTWLSVCRATEETSRLKKCGYRVFTVVVFLISITDFIASVVFFSKFASTDLEKALYALFQIASLFGSIYMLTVGIILGQEIITIFDNLSEIYDAYENDESYEFLVQANNQSEWIWKQFFRLVMVFAANSLLLVFISCLYCWLIIEHFDASLIYRSQKMILPWDETTVVGIGLSVCFDFLVCNLYLFAIGSYLLLFLSICLHHDAFYKMFEAESSKLDFHNENQYHNKILCKLILLHVRTKGWFLHSADIYRHFVLVQLITSAIFLSCTVFQLDLQLQHPDLESFHVFSAILVSASIIFIYCFYGKVATESFTKIPNCLYETNWPQISVNLQKYLIVMIANGQRPLYYHGFGIAVLDLETFQKLLKAVATYYMAFKTFTE